VEQYRRHAAARAISFVVAMCIGTAIGLALGRSPRADRFFDTWLIFFLNLPALVIIVLCYIWFGLTEVAAITAVAVNKIPNVAVNMREGARSLSKDLDEMAHIYRSVGGSAAPCDGAPAGALLRAAAPRSGFGARLVQIERCGAPGRQHPFSTSGSAALERVGAGLLRQRQPEMISLGMQRRAAGQTPSMLESGLRRSTDDVRVARRSDRAHSLRDCWSNWSRRRCCSLPMIAEAVMLGTRICAWPVACKSAGCPGAAVGRPAGPRQSPGASSAKHRIGPDQLRPTASMLASVSTARGAPGALGADVIDGCRC
jgi:hypothetical protein